MTKKKNIVIVRRNIDELIEAEYNPRQLKTHQYQQLKDSLTSFGFVDPVLVNVHKERKNIIIGGHQRVKVARDMGFVDVPCVELSLTPDQEKELNIRLNKISGEWDFDALANHFETEDLLEWGFDEKELSIDAAVNHENFADKLDLTYRLEITCLNEKEQETLYKKLTNDGYECRVLTL